MYIIFHPNGGGVGLGLRTENVTIHFLIKANDTQLELYEIKQWLWQYRVCLDNEEERAITIVQEAHSNFAPFPFSSKLLKFPSSAL